MARSVDDATQTDPEVEPVAASAAGNGAGGGDDDLDELEVDPPRRGRTALAISLVVALVLSGFVGVLATRDSGGREEPRVDWSVTGDGAYELSGRTIDGGNFDMRDFRGRWVVVNFFATWCVPCIQEHPELVDFQQAHSPDPNGPVLVSVLYDDDPDTATDFFEDRGGDWPVVVDRDGEIAVNYGVTGVPETYLVAPTGRILVRFAAGVTQGLLEQLIDETERQMAEQPAP